MIHIYIDTATYDEIVRDVKVTINAQLGLIGGTMGLLTGFSILSAVEIIYYLSRLLMLGRLFRARAQNVPVPLNCGQTKSNIIEKY